MTVKASQVNKFLGELREKLSILEMFQEHKQNALDNEENRDYPRDERLEKLQEQVDILEDAAKLLEEICDTLENYE